MKARFVMLRKAQATDDWEHVGAQEVEVGEDGLTESLDGTRINPEQRAIELCALPGVFVAVPFRDWVLFEAEAQVTVRQVATVAPTSVETPTGEPEMDPLLDDDMAGMTQGPKSR